MSTLTQGAARDAAIQRFASTYGTSRDILKHQVFDSRSFDATPTDYAFFQQPIGGSWRAGTKTLGETNMVDTGKLPNGQALLIKRMGVSFQTFLPAAATNAPAIAMACVNIMQSSVFEFRVASREWDIQIHGRQFLPALAIYGQNATNPTFRCGDTIASGWISLDDIPIVLDPLVNFKVNQYFNNPDSNVVTVLSASNVLLRAIYSTMQVTLEGTLSRPK